MDKRIVRGQIQYLIKWTGYPDSDNSWEPITNVYCPDIITEFENALINRNMADSMIDSNFFRNNNTNTREMNSDLSDDHNIDAIERSFVLSGNEYMDTRGSIISGDRGMNTRGSIPPGDGNMNPGGLVTRDNEVIMSTMNPVSSVNENLGTGALSQVEDETINIARSVDMLEKYNPDGPVPPDNSNSNGAPENISLENASNEIVGRPTGEGTSAGPNDTVRRTGKYINFDDSQFRHGYEPEEIIGATDDGGEMMFVIKWKNMNQSDLVSARLAKELWPYTVIKFYEDNLHFCSPSKILQLKN